MPTVDTVGVIPGGHPIRGLTLDRKHERVYLFTDQTTNNAYSMTPDGTFTAGADLGSAANRAIRSGIGDWVYVATDASLMKWMHATAYDVRLMTPPARCLAVGYAARGLIPAPPVEPPPTPSEGVTVAVSRVGFDKALTLRTSPPRPIVAPENGTNAPPPVDAQEDVWNTLAFDDAASWADAVTGAGGGPGAPAPDANTIGPRYYLLGDSASVNEQILTRTLFTLAAGSYSACEIVVHTRGLLLGVYVNGVLIGMDLAIPTEFSVNTFAVDPAILLPGQTNLIAAQVENAGFVQVWTSYRLEATPA
jgi:hypothetical protein